jgi:hypothetical protein
MKKTGIGSRKDNHIWTKNDNIIALYYYKYGIKLLGITEKEIINFIGTTLDSLKMQSANIQRLDNSSGGLSDYSDIQKEVYDNYNNHIEYNLRSEVNKIMNLDELIMLKELSRKGFGGRRLTRLEK